MAKYFSSTAPEQWSFKGFFEDYLLSSKSPEFQKIIDLYTRTLRDICKKSQNPAHSAQATSLLKAYKEGADHALARNLWAGYQRQKLPGATTTIVNIENIENVAVVHNQTNLGDAKGAETPTENKRRSKRQKRKSSPPPTYAEATDSSADDVALADDSKRRKTTEQSPLPKSLHEFHQEFLAMNPTHMWRLGTGTILEHALHKAVMESPQSVPELQLRWVIDPADPWMETFLTAGELDEVRMEGAALDAVAGGEGDCLSSLSKYSEVETTEQLRTILYSSQSAQGVEDEWIEAVLKQMLAMYENGSHPLKSKQLENWYEMNIWSVLVDHLFMRSVHDVTLLRKEATSFATVEALNHGRKTTGPGNYVKTGPRSDLIIRGVGSDFPLEYGAGETAAKYTGGTATKYIEDGVKLRVTMAHMLRRLVRPVEHEGVCRLQVVGLQCSGLRARVLRVSVSRGYVAIVRVEELNGVPDDVRRLPRIAPLMRALWRMKETVKECADAASRR